MSSAQLPTLPACATPAARLPVLLSLLLIAALLLAGCGAGKSAEAAAVDAPAAAAAPAAPAEESQIAAAAADVERAQIAAEAALLPSGAFAVQAAVPPQRLELPSIGLNTSIIELGWTSKKLSSGELVSEWAEADDAAGWHINSQRPGFGGNVVLSGHNNIKGAVFRELDLLKRGDPALLYVDNQTFEYVVDKVLIVPEKFASDEQRQKNFAYIDETDDERLTLVSCWPRDDNTHRIIVIARPVRSVTVEEGAS